MNKYGTSQSFVCRVALAVGVGITFSFVERVRAEPLPAELNLIPREAALFVSIRVADLWNDPRMKAIRDFTDKDSQLLRNFKKDNGFGPDELERLTILVAGVGRRDGPSEPCFVLTTTKPYNLERLLDAMNATTVEESQQFNKPMSPPIRGPRPAPKFEDKPKFPPKIEDKKDGDSFQKEAFFIQADKEDPDPPAKSKERKRDLKASYYIVRDRGYLIPINERTFVILNSPSFRGQQEIHELLSVLLRRSEAGPLSAALEIAAGKHPVVAGCNLSAIKNALPADSTFELLPIQSILASKSASLVVDLGEEIKFTLQIDSKDAAAAKRTSDLLKAIHVLGLEMLPGVKKQAAKIEIAPLMQMFPPIEKMVQEAQFEQKGTVATMTMSTKDDLTVWAATLAAAIEKVRDASDRARATNNLKQMVLAAHNYASAYQDRLPFPGIVDRNAKVDPKTSPKLNLSWRVTILPFIEQQNLYNAFHLDEPWDSEHNKKLIDQMPKIYAPPPGVSAPKGHTFYRVFTGPHTIGEGKYSIGNIPDGTSNTIMIVEAGESVPWTKPDEFPFDPDKPLPKLGGHFKGLMLVALADGSVRTIDLKKMSERTLKMAIQTDDGMVLPSDW